MKRKALIITMNDFVIYQPTILNLYDQMLPHFDVRIISFQPSYVTRKKDESRNICYIQPGRMAGYFLGKFDFVMGKVARLSRMLGSGFNYEYRYYNSYLPGLLKKWLKKNGRDADVVIAVDLQALHVAQEIYGPVHFLSLEIENKGASNYRKVDPGKLKSIFIQSEERKEYIFPGVPVRTFIVQNAPNFDASKKWTGSRNDFIYAGTARAVFGIYECIEFVKSYPPYRLVQKGGGEKKVFNRIKKVYADLIEEGRLVLDDSYLPASEFINYISKFRIGFCFYSWEWIEKFFNYRTAPSGKLFMYMASGVPVIACDIPGFKIVKEFNAGILVKDYRPETLKAAVEAIEKDYDHFSANCYRMAETLSFEKAVKPYVHYLISH